ncbi:hypothetical protein Ddye_025833 [Dipteronia dyeriana]|uniref:4-coumarate--CoA ligase n=1 Tax=Dipteronia dyeriana TaxID=168575 RepID=A0AAD9TLJ2_9ROSI|nr:hypothetical protein Ddye_025833 [Dipteronia dyeriana]
MEELRPSLVNSVPLTPLGFLEKTAAVYGDCPSIIYNTTTYTWSQTHRRCLQLASSLSSSFSIARGDVVSLVAPNVPAMYELHFAVPFTGAVLNSINTRLDARTVSVILQHGESKLVLVDYSLTSLVLQAVSLFPSNSKRPRLVLITDHDDDTCAAPITDGSGFCCTYESLVRRGDPEFEWVRPISEWDPIVLNYTSGTTSSPKGVVHCHRGIFIMTVDSLIEFSLPKRAVYLWTLPMFHGNGWCFPWAIAAVGGTNICVGKFDAKKIFGLIKTHVVTHMCGAPVLLNMITNSSPDNKPLKNPVHILTGGAPPPASLLLKVESLGFIVTHVYGLTEAAGVIVSSAWKPKWDSVAASERARLKARQGVKIGGLTRVDVVDPNTGASVKRDGSSIGEVVLRGGCMMLGYLKDPIGTRNCMRGDGWFYTGDIAVMHPDGYLEIKDRSKDVIISGGENVSSVEVESVLYANPAVYEAAVVARPDDYWGETPCAFVSLKGGLKRKPTEKEMMDYCRAKLPHYMVPKTVVFMEELPKTSTGKIKKFLLRDIAKGLSSGTARVSRM